MIKKFFSSVIILCFMVYAHCNESDELFRDSVVQGNVALCGELLDRGEISQEVMDDMFFQVLFVLPESVNLLPIPSRIAIGELLAKHGAPCKHDWLVYWVLQNHVFPVDHPEVWKILSSSIPEFDVYQKCALVNCLVRRQCYESYEDYPRFLEQLKADFGTDDKDHEFSSFIPKKEALEAYIDFCDANHLAFSSKEEMAKFIEALVLSPPEKLTKGSNLVFSGFLGLLDVDLGLTIHPEIKSHLLMNFFQFMSMESAHFEGYHLDIPFLYFTDRYFEKQPFGLNPQVIIGRIFGGIKFKKLEKMLRLSSQEEITSIYAWYHLLNTKVVQEYIQTLSDEKKVDCQKKVELLFKFAIQEGCDKDNLISIFTKRLNDAINECLEFTRENLAFFRGGTIGTINNAGDNACITLYSRDLNEEELRQFSESEIAKDFIDDENIECRIIFLQVESLQLDAEWDNEDDMTISHLTLEGDNQITIDYFKEGDANPYFVKVQAKKMFVFPM